MLTTDPVQFVVDEVTRGMLASVEGGSVGLTLYDRYGRTVAGLASMADGDLVLSVFDPVADETRAMVTLQNGVPQLYLHDDNGEAVPCVPGQKLNP